MPTTRHHSKRDSKKLPDGLLEDISKFQILGFAKQYFAEHRRGLFRRHVPVEVMLKYQSSALKAPLMVISPTLKKDACKCFKLIQKIMTPKADKTTNNANIQVLIEKGIRHGGLRDEIFLQICKVSPAECI